MADLSAQLDEILQKHNTQLGHHRKSLDTIRDEFLNEAYRIVEPLNYVSRYLLISAT